MSLETRNRSNERLISHLNLQVDYLQQTNQELEDRIRELEDGKSVAILDRERMRSEVDRLRDELRSIDRLAQQLEQEKQDAVSTADREIQDAQRELRNSQRIEENTESRLLDVTAARDSVMRENKELESDLEAIKLDVERLNGLLDKVQADKHMLGEKLHQVTGREKSLVMELEQFRISPSKARRKDRSASKLDRFVKNLEEERDHFKEECDALQSMLQDYKCKNQPPSPRSRSPRRASPSRKGGDSSQSYEALLRERDELQTMLGKFERHMAEIQANVKVLTKERDKTNLLYEQTNDELQRLRREYVRSPKSPRASVTAQAILRRVEGERDSAIADLRRMTTERDSLRERLKIQQEQSINERSRLEQRAEDYENKARSFNEDKIDLQNRNEALKDVNLTQEEDIKSLRLKVQQLEDEYQAVRSELDDVKLVKTQVESSLESTQRNLSRKANEVAMAEDRVRSLEGRVGELLDETEKQSDEMMNLRATTTTLDREKDALQAALDERAERVASLENQLSRREREIGELRATLSGLESKVDRLSEELACSDREVRSLRRQLDISQSDLNECVRAKETGSRENRRLQDDVTSLSRKNQDLSIEIDVITRSRDDLKNQVEENLSRINDLDAAMSTQERELQDVLDKYRKVSSERDAAEGRYRASSDEAQTLRGELLATDGDRKRCMDKILVMEREANDNVRAQQSYEAQICSLRATVSNLETDIERIKTDRLTLQGDLQSAQDMNIKLDGSKEQVARQLAAKCLENDQLKSNCEDLNRELEIVHKHLEAERAGNKNLEDLVSGVREKEFQAQLDAQEQKSESQLLRDKLALNESKLQSMAREVSSLRDRTSQLDAELEVTKRHLTNERYEREKAVQELRRSGYPSPGFSRLSRPLSPTSRVNQGSPTRLSFLNSSR